MQNYMDVLLSLTACMHEENLTHLSDVANTQCFEALRVCEAHHSSHPILESPGVFEHVWLWYRPRRGSCPGESTPEL